MKEIIKFGYINSMILTNLFYKGFCQPIEESKDQKENDSGNMVDGTGFLINFKQ